MAPIVKNEALLRVNGIQEVAAKPHCKSDYTHEIAWRRIVLDVFGFHLHGAEKAHIVRWRDEDKGVFVSARPFHRSLRTITRQAGPEDIRLARRRPQLVFQLLDKGQINVMLVD